MTVERFMNDKEISDQMEQFLTLIKTFVDLGENKQCKAILIKSFIILHLQYICKNKELAESGKIETDQIIFNIAHNITTKIVGVFPNPAVENTFLDYRNINFEKLTMECAELLNKPLEQPIKKESIN